MDVPGIQQFDSARGKAGRARAMRHAANFRFNPFVTRELAIR